MVVLRRGNDEQVARSPYIINSLKKQGFKEVTDDALTIDVDEPTEAPVETPEAETPTKKPKKGGKKS